MNKLVEKLSKELHSIDQRKRDLQKALEAVQKVCDHNFIPHASTHKEIEKCTECGLEITI